MELRYRSPGQTIAAFRRSNAYIQGIRGPFGSGKSTACVVKLLKHAHTWPACVDGKVRTRWAVIRNTYPELKTTTIKTWHQWVPPTVGRWVDSGPPTHHLKLPGGIEAEFIFLALDRAEDVAKLLSFEITGAWINEAREVPRSVLDAISGRCGRYPPASMLEEVPGRFLRSGAPFRRRGWTGVIMDTNPSDTDEWWYQLAEEQTEDDRAKLAELQAQLVELGSVEEGQPLMEFFAQPSGRSPAAENMDNLDPGYYLKLQIGKTEDWIRVYVDGEYGYVRDGKPVFPSYRDSIHCRAFDVPRGAGLVLGLDFGLTPSAAVLVPRGPRRWGVRSEVVSERLSIKAFAVELRRHLAEHYPGVPVQGVWGDPSGEAGQPGSDDASTVFEILRANGVPAYPAPGNNDPVLRVEAVEQLLQRMDDGEPALLIHPDAKVIRKGFAGKYHYARVKVQGAARYHDKPVKNLWSHPCEGVEYGLLGGGEALAVMRSPGSRSVQSTAET